MTKKLVSFDDQAEPGEGLPAAVKAELNATYATKTEVTDELTTRATPVVAGIIANDPTVAQAAANLAQSDAGLLRDWSSANRLNGSAGVANSITAPGTYPNGWSDSATIEAMGLPSEAGPGVLEVLSISSTVVLQRYIDNLEPGNMYARASTGNDTWGPWKVNTASSGGQIASTTGAAMGRTGPGIYQNGWPKSYSATQGLPDSSGEGILEVFRISPALLVQRYTAISPTRVWVRFLSGTTWNAWVRIGTDPVPVVPSVPEVQKRGLYARSRPTPDVNGHTITPLAMDPNVPGRMWSQGTRFGQLGYGPVDGSGFTAIGSHNLDFGGGKGIIGAHFSSTHMWATTGPMQSKQGAVWRSPLPVASFSGAYDHGLSFTKVFDLAAPPSGITVGDNAYWRNSVLATDPTGQKVLLGEYGNVVTGGASLYYSTDSGGTWTKMSPWPNSKHIHAVRYFTDLTPGAGGEWWVQIGDANFADLGMWSCKDDGLWNWERRSARTLDGVDHYGINMFPIETAPGVVKMVTESDTVANHGPTFLPVTQATGPREFTTSGALPAAQKGTMRQLTYDPETGNLYWYQTSELGALNTTDSIWMLPPPYTEPILLEEFPFLGGGETQGDPVIWGDYLWLGRNRIRKELTTAQV